MRSSSRVLIVGAGTVTEAVISAQLRRLGWSSQTAQDEDEALALWATDAFACAIIDDNGLYEPRQLALRLRHSSQSRHRSPATILGFVGKDSISSPENQIAWNGLLSRPSSHRELSSLLPQRCQEPTGDAFSVELIRRLHDATRRDLEETRHAVASEDWQTAAAVMHRVKGAARMVGEKALGEAAAAAEASALASTASTRQLLDTVADELVQLRRRIGPA